jgi:hypothetical protein
MAMRGALMVNRLRHNRKRMQTPFPSNTQRQQ